MNQKKKRCILNVHPKSTNRDNDNRRLCYRQIKTFFLLRRQQVQHALPRPPLVSSSKPSTWTSTERKSRPKFGSLAAKNACVLSLLSTTGAILVLSSSTISATAPPSRQHHSLAQRAQHYYFECLLTIFGCWVLFDLSGCCAFFLDLPCLLDKSLYTFA